MFKLFKIIFKVIFFISLVSILQGESLNEDFSLERDIPFGAEFYSGFGYYVSPNFNFPELFFDSTNFSRIPSAMISHYYRIPISFSIFYWKTFWSYSTYIEDFILPFSKIKIGLRWGKADFIKKLYIGMGIRKEINNRYGYIIIGLGSEIKVIDIKFMKLNFKIDFSLFPYSFNSFVNPLFYTETEDKLIYAGGGDYKFSIGLQFWKNGPFVYLSYSGYLLVPIYRGILPYNENISIYAKDLILEQKLTISTGYRFSVIVIRKQKKEHQDNNKEGLKYF